jgi:nucleoside-diphosphate-sugar epimerase
MRVMLAGATGAIGRPLVGELRERGHEVVALHRSAGGERALRDAGATPVRVDVLDRDALLAAVDGERCDAVVSQLTALKKMPVTHRDMAATDRLRSVGTANLVAAAERTGAQRFVTQSMVLGYGYGDHGDRVLTEDDEFAPAGRGRFEQHLAAMRTNERLVLGSSRFEGIALRFGLFYGPGPAGAAMLEGVRRRRLPVVRTSGPLPFVDIDDAVQATVAALERAPGGAAYNIADDEPVSLSALVGSLAEAVGAPAPRVVPSWLLGALPYGGAVMRGGLRVSTAKAKAELGWAPAVPTYRVGVGRMAAHEASFAR